MSKPTPYYDRQRILPGRYWFSILLGWAFSSVGIWISDRLAISLRSIIVFDVAFLIVIIGMLIRAPDMRSKHKLLAEIVALSTFVSLVFNVLLVLLHA